jgi:chemotaxis protein CheY-P-specific phosphatase CheC
VFSAVRIEIEPRCNEDDDDDDANDEVKHDAVVNVMNIMSSIVSELAATLFFDEIIVA